ncbi:hypothetical protein F6X42_37740 [Paraburkholderia sp. WC7.3b]|uniref:Uncharacterized protein n=1 Tax=Paraburkholderia podalyriae TaxID=1938811 RepID=A0ABR7Q0D1_9BURK|nr:hypothetical protein [Paraburkholderia podalyriae]
MAARERSWSSFEGPRRRVRERRSHELTRRFFLCSNRQGAGSSCSRYLDLIETADRISPTGFDVKTVASG